MSISNETGTRPCVSVIIAFYKRLDFLELILDQFDKQSDKRFEVIIAEDDNAPETVDFINKKRKKVCYTIRHVSQDDHGFRKNRALNHAISVATSEIIAFIDGDCIPHSHFVKEYARNVKPGVACFGRRVMLGKKLTDRMIAHKHTMHLSCVSLLMSDSRKIEEAIYLPFTIRRANKSTGIWGCNWGVYKKDIENVNGFDEDYVHACVGEDKDIEYRLQSSGIRFKSIKNRAIVFHLNHKENYTPEAFRINNELFTVKCLQNNYYCTNGLHK